MKAARLGEGGPVRYIPMVMFWIGLAILGLGLGVVMAYLKIKTLHAGQPVEQLVSHQSASYANLLLIGSTILDVSRLRFTSERVGPLLLSDLLSQ